MSAGCTEGEPGVSVWEATGDRTDIQGTTGFLGSAVCGRAEKSNIPAKPARITMVTHIISISPYLLVVLSNENVSLCTNST